MYKNKHDRRTDKVVQTNRGKVDKFFVTISSICSACVDARIQQIAKTRRVGVQCLL